jgi:hypothetical protein
MSHRDSILGLSSDTYVDFYRGLTLLAGNDDNGGALASLIVFTAPATANNYLLRIGHFSSSVFGADTNYDVKVRHFGAGTFGAGTNYDFKVTCS